MFIDEWCDERNQNGNIKLADLLECYDSGRLSSIWISLHKNYSNDNLRFLNASDKQEVRKRFHIPKLGYNLRNSKEIAELSISRLPPSKRDNEPLIGKAMVDGIKPKIYRISSHDFETDFTKKLRDSLRYCCEERCEERIAVALPWGSSQVFIGTGNVEEIAMKEIIRYCRRNAKTGKKVQKCYICFNQKDVSTFLSRLEEPTSSSCERIQSSDISTYVTEDAVKFISNHKQDGIFVSDADTIEGFQFSTLISIFAEQLNVRKPEFEKTQTNIFSRAIGNLVVIEEMESEDEEAKGNLSSLVNIDAFVDRIFLGHNNWK